MENEENLTAIEWLMEQIVFKHKGGLHPVYGESKDLTKFFKKALKMEKQQIMDSYDDGGYAMFLDDDDSLDPEIYYKSKFNN